MCESCILLFSLKRPIFAHFSLFLPVPSEISGKKTGGALSFEQNRLIVQPAPSSPALSRSGWRRRSGRPRPGTGSPAGREQTNVQYTRPVCVFWKCNFLKRSSKVIFATKTSVRITSPAPKGPSLLNAQVFFWS